MSESEYVVVRLITAETEVTKRIKLLVSEDLCKDPKYIFDQIRQIHEEDCFSTDDEVSYHVLGTHTLCIPQELMENFCGQEDEIKDLFNAHSEEELAKLNPTRALLNNPDQLTYLDIK